MFKPNQPFRKTTTYNGEHSMMPVTVKVLRTTGTDDDDEPMWRIQMPESGKTLTVPESDLHPAPDAWELMREKFATLTDGFESPLVMSAAVEAIHRYRDQIVENEADSLQAMERSMVNGPAWIAAVKRAAEIVDPK